MKDLIETERASGIYISVLGFGMGNLKDVTMETIADNGNGNYAYIDTLAEAEKVLVHEFDSTMLVIAQDLKLQVEFNPATVAEYRLIGYNNRRLENEDFNDDTKDAGDIGAGHSVTALYEIVPAGAGSGAVAPLKYQETAPSTGSADFMTVKIRYKKPGQTQSVASDYPVGPQASTDRPSVDADFATAVAEFGLILTGSRFAANSSLADVESRAASALGQDEYGLRSEFCDLVARYRTLVA
jgi:Ca-activated chloride channel family protein